MWLLLLSSVDINKNTVCNNSRLLWLHCQVCCVRVCVCVNPGCLETAEPMTDSTQSFLGNAAAAAAATATAATSAAVNEAAISRRSRWVKSLQHSVARRTVGGAALLCCSSTALNTQSFLLFTRRDFAGMSHLP